MDGLVFPHFERVGVRFWATFRGREYGLETQDTKRSNPSDIDVARMRAVQRPFQDLMR